MSRRKFHRLSLAICALVLCACADAGASLDPLSNCGDLSALSLEGTWDVVATGTRYDCDGARYEGEISIEVDPFAVYASIEAAPSVSMLAPGTEPQAFVERVRTAPISLTASIADDNVEFEGGGSECAIYFTLRETLSKTTTLEYNFEGWLQDVDRATGTLTGSGPGKCKVRGEFTVRRR